MVAPVDPRIASWSSGAQQRDDPAVLLLQDRDAWTLPCVELPEQRSADISELNRAVPRLVARRRPCSTASSTSPAPTAAPRRHLQVLEAHGRARPAVAGGRWMTRTRRARRCPPNPDAWTAPWRVGCTLAPPRYTTRGNGRAGAGATRRSHGWPTSSTAVDGRPCPRSSSFASWEFSQVLALDTAGGRFYFKARPAVGRA